MKKMIFILALGLVMTIGLTGCFNKKTQKIDRVGLNQEQIADKSKTSKQEAEKNKKQDDDSDKEESFFGSMQDLLGRGKSLKCAYKEKTPNAGESEAVMYISGGRVRTEMEINTGEGKTIENDMIIDQDWMYMWNSFAPNGTKMNIKAMPKGDDLTKDDINKGMANLSKNLDYKCRAWIPDSSKFKTPADINFMDITEDMKRMAEMMEGLDMEAEAENMEEEANKMICDLCKNAPSDEAKEECLGEVVCD